MKGRGPSSVINNKLRILGKDNLISKECLYPFSFFYIKLVAYRYVGVRRMYH